MATILLAAALPSGTSALTTAVLSGLAGYVDNAFIFPKLFPGPEPDPPKLGDLKMTADSEGSPMVRCWGPENRVPGTRVWTSDVIAEKRSEGGKGGKEVEFYEYFVSFAVAWNDQPSTAVKKVYLPGGNLLYDESGNNLSVTDNTGVLEGISVPTSGIPNTNAYLWIRSYDENVDLTIFRSGKDLTSAGWINPENNGVFRVGSTLTGPGYTQLELITVDAKDEDPGPGQLISLAQNLGNFDDTLVDSVTHYLGVESQAPDPTIEAIEGVGNVPAYRSQTYSVFERYRMGRNITIPPQLQALVEESPTRTAGEVISSIIDEKNSRSKPQNQIRYDVTGVTGNVRGYAARGPIEPKSALQPIMIAHDVFVQNRNGVFTFYHRDAIEVISINARDVRSYEDGSDPGSDVRMDQAPNPQSPKQINLTYVDADNEYQDGATRSSRIDSATVAIAQTSLPLVLSGDDARSIVERLLWTNLVNAQTAKLSLPPTYERVLEGDVLAVPRFGRTLPILVNQVTRGANGLIEIQGVIERASALNFTNTSSEPPAGGGGNVYIPPELIGFVFDVAPLTDAHATQMGYYHAVAAQDAGVSFIGSTLFRSGDDIEYFEEGQRSIEASIGLLLDMNEGTPNAAVEIPVVHPCFDQVNTLTIRMYEGSPPGTTETEMVQRGNLALWGREIISFQNVTLKLDGTFVLSKLMRGLQGTEDQMGAHAVGDRFILLGDGGVAFQEDSAGSIGRTFFYKNIPAGGALPDFGSTTYELDGGFINNFAPTDLRGSYSGGDLVIGWSRRTRSPSYDNLGAAAAPLYDNPESYDVVINDAAPTRTFSGVTTNSVTYTKAQQAADGFLPGALMSVSVFQNSPITGRGKEATRSIRATD